MGKSLLGKDLGKGITQRKDGRYQARIKVNGKTVCIYNTNLTQLKKDFAALKEEQNKQSVGIKEYTLNEWYYEWFTTCKAPQLKSEQNARIYDRKTRNTLLKILGSKLIKDIQQKDIQIASNQLLESYSKRTIQEAVGVVRECLETAMLNRLIDMNPCQNIKIKDTNTKEERRVLEHWEQDMFIEEVKGSYYYEAYMFLLLTGVRIGEFSGLQWNDIDFENKLININRSMSTGYIDGRKIEQLTTPKTSNSYRVVPFFGNMKDILTSWKKKQDDCKKSMGDRWRCKPEHGDLVFTNTLGSPITRYNLPRDIDRVVNNMRQKEFRNACIEGREPREIKGLYPHAFRHTFATRCMEKDMKPAFIQAIMGHSDYATTLSYTHVLNDLIKKESEKGVNFL